MFITELLTRLYFTVWGIGAASGLIKDKDTLYIIGDDSPYLYAYSEQKQHLEKIDLNLAGHRENASKKDKLDFEAIADCDSLLYIFGSGSRYNRSVMVVYNKKSGTAVAKDISVLYRQLRKAGSITRSQFNIEGATIKDNTLLLFQRGNGPERENGIFKIHFLNTLDKVCAIRYHHINLPLLDGMQTTFSDALWIDDYIFFTASTESTRSTYADGPSKGSMIGMMRRKDFNIIKMYRLKNSGKVEGITLLKKGWKSYSFLLCEDNDDNAVRSKIYQVSFPIPASQRSGFTN